jgi:hypothetical protein
MAKAKPYLDYDFTETYYPERLTPALRLYFDKYHPEFSNLFFDARLARDNDSDPLRPLAHLCLNFNIYPPCGTLVVTPYPLKGNMFTQREAGGKMLTFVERFCTTMGLPDLAGYSDLVRDYENPRRIRLRITIPSDKVDGFIDSLGLEARRSK